MKIKKDKPVETLETAYAGEVKDLTDQIFKEG